MKRSITSCRSFLPVLAHPFTVLRALATRSKAPATSRANTERLKVQRVADEARKAEAKQAALKPRAKPNNVKSNQSAKNKTEAPGSASPTDGEQMTEQKRMPLVAIVGRPNVGKSTLFNRLVGRRHHSRQSVVDTGGVMGNDRDYFSPHIKEQAMLAVKEADVILFLVDTLEGLTPEDRMLASILRKKGGDLSRSILVLANKADNRDRTEMAEQFKCLGLPLLSVSAAHGSGMSDLLDAIAERLPDNENEEEEDDDARVSNGDSDKTSEPKRLKRPVRVAIVGRPNVGKSSLLNRILGFERSIVSPIAGTTHDPVDQTILWRQKRPITLVDTAGITQRGRHKKGVDSASILWAIKVIARADIVCLLLDGQVGPTEEDQRVASYIQDSFKSAVIVLNKTDLLPNKSNKALEQYERGIRDSLKFMDYVPVVLTSALQGSNVDAVIDMALKVYDEKTMRLSTNALVKVQQRALGLRFKFITQARGSPTFVCFVNRPELVHFSYERFIENAIRETYPFTGSPIKVVFKKAAGKERNFSLRKPSKRRRPS